MRNEKNVLRKAFNFNSFKIEIGKDETQKLVSDNLEIGLKEEYMKVKIIFVNRVNLPQNEGNEIG